MCQVGAAPVKRTLISICQIFLMYYDLNWFLFKVTWMELMESPISPMVK